MSNIDSMRYFFDTEFIDDGHTIDLISIGVVADNGREFYAVSNEAELASASDWVWSNVIPHLPPRTDPAWMSRMEIAHRLFRFVGQNGSPPEFWAYYASYDWVALCQLFGPMIDVPRDWPKWCRDLKQLSEFVGGPRHPKQVGQEHHALADARWNRELYYFLIQAGKIGR